MANEVRIKLTDEQKAKIRETTGQEVGEIRVSNLGHNPAVTPTSSPKVASARINQARANAAPRVNQARANAAPRVNQARANAAPRVNQARANAAPRIMNARATDNAD